jgi:hypothetical protein
MTSKNMDFTEYIPPCSLAHSVNLNGARGGVRTNGAFDSYTNVLLQICIFSRKHVEVAQKRNGVRSRRHP